MDFLLEECGNYNMKVVLKSTSEALCTVYTTMEEVEKLDDMLKADCYAFDEIENTLLKDYCRRVGLVYDEEFGDIVTRSIEIWYQEHVDNQTRRTGILNKYYYPLDEYSFNKFHEEYYPCFYLVQFTNKKHIAREILDVIYDDVNDESTVILREDDGEVSAYNTKEFENRTDTSICTLQVI